jgi:hypothetical protein
MRRDLENRSVSYAEGYVRVDDRHSRLRLPLPLAPAAALSELFGIERGVLEQAFAVVGPDSPPSAEATLTAYLETDATPDAAIGAIASPAGYRHLVEKVADVVAEESTGTGFRLTLGAPGGPETRASPSTVTPEPAANASGRATSRSSPTRTRNGKTHSGESPGGSRDLLATTRCGRWPIRRSTSPGLWML